jgi:hypothetical protein
MFSVWSTTEATTGHLEIAIIAKKEETVAWQVKRQGNAWTVFRLIWNCSHGIHPRWRDCIQAPLWGDPLPSMQFNSLQECWALVQVELAVATRQHRCTSLCACPRGAGKTTGHRFATPSPLERKAMWASISVSRGDCHCHKGSRMGPSCKCLSVVFPAAIPTLADLHSGQPRLFWGSMWICVSACEYLVTWCDKTTVH